MKRIIYALISMLLLFSLFNWIPSVKASDETPMGIAGSFVYEDDNVYENDNSDVTTGIPALLEMQVVYRPIAGKKTMDLGVRVMSFTSAPVYIDCTVTLLYATTPNGPWLAKKPITVSPKVFVGAFKTVKLKLDRTYFYKFRLKTNYRFKGSTDSSSTGEAPETALINRMGRVYPSQIDPGTGVLIPAPNTTLLPKSPKTTQDATRKNFDNSVKKSYRTWWETTYNQGEPPNYTNVFGGMFNSLKKPWDGYEIHHITPIEFGGTNVYSNLVPLPKSYHTQYTTWWAGYYGVNK
ncbi:HNH endonuclease signature motif containing protein [Paenibacillus sp. FSL R10-2199]|uniref:HNH endonuclease signature motif containing protein n=1 Tax=Paenibacillus sp. FSL R10-2199 TaxID=2975348 RepID=UPI0030FAD4C3